MSRQTYFYSNKKKSEIEIEVLKMLSKKNILNKEKEVAEPFRNYANYCLISHHSSEKFVKTSSCSFHCCSSAT